MSGIQTNTSAIALPGEVSKEIIKKAQEASAVMTLGHSMPLPGLGTTIPVITGDPEAEWVEETKEKPVSNPGLSTKNMKPYTLAVIVPFSNQFRRNMPALYNAIVERLPKALSAKFDATVFGRVAVPGSDFDTLASCTQQSLGSDPYAALVAAKVDIADHDGIANGYVIAPRAEGILLSATDTTGRPLFIDSVADGSVPKILGAATYKAKAAYTPVPAGKDIVGIAGDWTQAIYGISDKLSLSISDQATINVNGEQINLWQRNMFAVRCEMECGFRADTNVFNLLTV